MVSNASTGRGGGANYGIRDMRRLETGTDLKGQPNSQRKLIGSRINYFRFPHSMTAVGTGETSSHLMATSESVTIHPQPRGEGTSRQFSRHLPIWQPDSLARLRWLRVHSDRVVACRGQSPVCQTLCASRHWHWCVASHHIGNRLPFLLGKLLCTHLEWLANSCHSASEWFIFLEKLEARDLAPSSECTGSHAH